MKLDNIRSGVGALWDTMTEGWDRLRQTTAGVTPLGVHPDQLITRLTAHFAREPVGVDDRAEQRYRRRDTLGIATIAQQHAEFGLYARLFLWAQRPL